MGAGERRGCAARTHFDPDFLAECVECGLDLIEPGTMAEIKEAVYIGFGNPHAARQLSLAHAGSEKEPVKLGLGALEGRQADHPDLLASGVTCPAAGAARRTECALVRVFAEERRPSRELRFRCRPGKRPAEIGDRDGEAAFFRGFKHRWIFHVDSHPRSIPNCLRLL